MRGEIWAERAEILRPFSGTGIPMDEIARTVGINPATVATYAKAFGFDFGHHRSDAAGVQSTIRDCAAAGKTRQETAEHLGIPVHTVGTIARKHGINFVHGSVGVGVDLSRAESMAAMYVSGKTLAEIGGLYGLSRERVRQIIKKQHGMNGANGGRHVSAIRASAAKEAKRDFECLAKFGCKYPQYRSLIELGKSMRKGGASYSVTPVGAFHSQKASAANRNIEWRINLWDWWNVWVDAGKWEKRGRGKSAFVMCRFGDCGAYEAGNVYIATHSHNSSFQPNNPHRKDHPDHADVVAESRKKTSARTRKTRQSKYNLPLGVTLQRGRYIGQISVYGKNKHIGSFDTPEEAHAAYLATLSEINAEHAA